MHSGLISGHKASNLQGKGKPVRQQGIRVHWSMAASVRRSIPAGGCELTMCSSTGSSSGAPAWQPYLRAVAARGAAGSAHGWALRQAACPPCAAAATSAAQSGAGPGPPSPLVACGAQRPMRPGHGARSPDSTGRTSQRHQMGRMPRSLAIVQHLYRSQDKHAHAASCP